MGHPRIRRLTAILAAIALCASLSACGKKKTTANTAAKDNTASEAAVTFRKGAVSMEFANVRTSPQLTEDNKIDTIKKGTPVVILDEMNGWYKIQYETEAGYAYVSAGYIEVTSAAGSSQSSADQTPAVFEKKTGTVTKKGVLVRKTPDVLNNNKLGTLQKGASVTVIGQTDDWYQIEYKTDAGYAYVSAQYISFESPASSTTASTTTTVPGEPGYVKEGVVNVRTSPQVTENNKAGSLKKGDTVGILEKLDGWYKIAFNNQAGYAYVSSDCIQLGTPTSATTTAPAVSPYTGGRKEGTVTKNGVLVRSAPQVSNNNKLGTLKKGASVTVVEQTGDWYKIEYNTSSGFAYISSSYVTFTIAATSPTVTFTTLSAKTKGTINDNGVWLRSTPEISNQNRVIMLTKNTKVTVVAQANGWYKIESSKTTSGYAYISSQFVTITAQTASTTAPALNFVSGQPQKGTVTKNGVLVRSAPQVSESTKLATLKKGASVTVVEQADGWYKIKYNTSTGYAYISSQYVTFTANTSSTTAAPSFPSIGTKKQGVINDSGIWIRRKPVIENQNRLMMLQKNDKVTVVGYQNGWYEIECSKTDSGYAYISSQFVTLTAETTAATNASAFTEKKKGTITKNGVYIRSAPQVSDQTKITTLKKGTAVTVIGQTGDWYKIEYNSAAGYAYVSAKFVDTSTVENDLSDAQKLANANEWLSFAKAYANSIGLSVKDGQQGGWDAPIPAERDSSATVIKKAITDRLDNYRQYNITTVRLWLTHDYNNEWELIIAYS